MARRGTTKFKSNLQEKKVASEISGRTVIASGSLWGSKGDVRSDKFLVECKTTDKDYYTLQYSTWEKIYKESARDGLRIPAMCIDLEGGKYRMAVISPYYEFPLPDIEVKTTSVRGKSFRVRYTEEVVEVEFQSILNRAGKPYCLTILPWRLFINCSSLED